MWLLFERLTSARGRGGSGPAGGGGPGPEHLGRAGHGPPAGPGCAAGDLPWNALPAFGETFWFAAAVTGTLDKIIAMERRDLH